MSAHTLEVREAVGLAPPPPVDAIHISDPFDEVARLGPARAVANGLLISIPFWLLLGFAVWLFWF